MEFLIKRTDGEWFSLHKKKFAETLKPSSIPSKTVEGWGDHRIEIANGIISFSYEDPGIQVCFENFTGTYKEAYKIVKEILKKIEVSTNEKGKIIEL